MNTQKLLLGLCICLISLPTQAGWKYRSEVDKMRDTKTEFAELRSKNGVQLSFPYQGGTFLEIVVNKTNEGGAWGYLWTNRGQLMCFSGCHFNVKFDSGDVEDWRGYSTSDGSSDTIYIENYNDFLIKLKAASKVIVEVEMYDEGRRQFFFDTKNLKSEF